MTEGVVENQCYLWSSADEEGCTNRSGDRRGRILDQQRRALQHAGVVVARMQESIWTRPHAIPLPDALHLCVFVCARFRGRSDDKKRTAVEGCIARPVFGHDGIVRRVPAAHRRASHASHSAIAVPPDAIVQDQGVAHVYVLRTPEVFELRAVKTGGSRRGNVEITSGLKPEERIVIRGADKIPRRK